MTKKVVLRGGTLIDGTGAMPIPDGTIQFEDGKILAVGPTSQFGETGFEGAEVINVQGNTILPGFVNCHDHLDNRYGLRSFEARATEPVPYLVARGVRNALIALQEGITTVRYIAYKNMNHIGLKEAINQGMVLGPRIVACGPPISMTGGHAWQISIEADGPDAVRRIARQQLKEGVDVIKCMGSGGFVSASGDKPWSPQLTVEEMRAAFDEAHKAGKPTTVHAHPPQAIRWAVDAGVDCIEHGGLLDRETAEFLARKGIWLVPTLGEGWVAAYEGEAYGLDRWLMEMSRDGLEERARRFGYAVEAGVRMAVGTDVWPSIAKEMQLMVEWGMTPMDVLVAATHHGAEACCLSDQVGTLEVGKWADVIVLDGNPLDDLSALSRVKQVFKEGVLYQPESLAAVTGRYPL